MQRRNARASTSRAKVSEREGTDNQNTDNAAAGVSSGNYICLLGVKVNAEAGACPKRIPSTTKHRSRLRTDTQQYLPKYKLESMGETGCYVVRYNGHRVAKDEMKYVDVEILSNEKDIRLEPLPPHGRSGAWMKP